MSDMMQRGQAWLSEKLTQHISREVIYRRGEAEFTVTATIGKTVAEQETGDGLILKAEIRDYLINTTDLVLSGERILPKRGDQIIEDHDGNYHVYEVLPIGNQRVWRYSDPFRIKLRIHTKRIGEE